MPEGAGEIRIQELRQQVEMLPPNIEGHASAEKEALMPIVSSLKTATLDFIKAHGEKAWLTESIGKQAHLDGIVADMRHIPGGQEFALRELQKLKPDISWYRGGTLTKFRDSIGPKNTANFTEEDLNTHIIDGGANGVLGSPSLALSYLEVTPRANPALYTLTLDNLIEGLTTNAVALTSEHNYDLNVVKGDRNWTKYLDFCRKNLKIQRVVIDQK